MTAQPDPHDAQLARTPRPAHPGVPVALSSVLVAEDLARAEWAEETLRSIAELDAIARSALSLVYWQGHTLSQAANELSLSESTVQGHLARGLRQLGTRLLASNSPAPNLGLPDVPSAT